MKVKFEVDITDLMDGIEQEYESINVKSIVKEIINEFKSELKSNIRRYILNNYGFKKFEGGVVLHPSTDEIIRKTVVKEIRNLFIPKGMKEYVKNIIKNETD